MTPQPKTEGYREQFEKETGLMFPQNMIASELSEYWCKRAKWLESRLATVEKEREELRLGLEVLKHDTTMQFSAQKIVEGILASLIHERNSKP